MTNAEKFKEVFDVEPKKDTCLFFQSEYCKKLRCDCTKCKHDDWWNKDYLRNKVVKKMRMTDEQAIEILEEVKELDDSIFQFNTAYMEALDYVIQKMKSLKNVLGDTTINIDKKIVYRFFCLSPMKKREILREFPNIKFDIDNDDAEDLLYQLDKYNDKELFWNKLCQIG